MFFSGQDTRTRRPTRGRKIRTRQRGYKTTSEDLLVNCGLVIGMAIGSTQISEWLDRRVFYTLDMLFQQHEVHKFYIKIDVHMEPAPKVETS